MAWAGVSWSFGVVIAGRRLMPRSDDLDESSCQLSWYLYEDVEGFDDDLD